MRANSPFSILHSQFFAFIKKEFFHIWRDKSTLFILLGMPVAQIIIFGFALTNEVKNAKFAVLDQSKDIASQQLITEMDASRYFDLAKKANQQAMKIKDAFKEIGIDFLSETFTNQIFPILTQNQIEQLSKNFDFYVWKKVDEEKSAIRLITSWATTDEVVCDFINEIKNLR